MKSRSAHTSIYFYGRSFRKPVTRLGLLLSWENHICSGEKEGCWTRVNRSNVENMLTVSSKTFTTCMLYIRSFAYISHDIPQYDKSQVDAVSSCPFFVAIFLRKNDKKRSAALFQYCFMIWNRSWCVDWFWCDRCLWPYRLIQDVSYAMLHYAMRRICITLYPDLLHFL